MPGSGRRSGQSGPSWGWHRLADAWATRLVEEAAIGSGTLVLDVGAGDGALTRPLLDAGAHVVAVELHPRRLAELRRLAATEPRLTVVAADAAGLRLPRRDFAVVSNPPFAVTSALLRRLLARGSHMIAADLVVQRQVARRWASADAPGYPRWSATWHASMWGALPRQAFTPRPRVDAAILRIRRH